jgi:hypothetical protein
MIKVNLEKAKLIAHDIRRQKRDAEFAPLDEIISKQLPGYTKAEIETKRKVIRSKYDEMQKIIDAATTVDEISTAIM